VILKKPIFMFVVLSLVLTIAFAVPQSALAVPPPDECPPGTSLIAKYNWNGPDDEGPDGWIFEKYYDVITITGDAYSGTWDSGSILIEAVFLKDGNTPDGQEISWLYEYPEGVTSGSYFASDMTPPQDPPHAISHISFCGNTFPVSLTSFNARANRGIVAIDWLTATEINTAGFILYRSTTVNGPRVQVNAFLIAAQGNQVTGAYYRITDTPGYGTFYYWLKDVDYSGQSALHGPAVVKVLPAIRQPVVRPSLPVQ